MHCFLSFCCTTLQTHYNKSGLKQVLSLFLLCLMAAHTNGIADAIRRIFRSVTGNNDNNNSNTSDNNNSNTSDNNNSNTSNNNNSNNVSEHSSRLPGQSQFRTDSSSSSSSGGKRRTRDVPAANPRKRDRRGEVQTTPLTCEVADEDTRDTINASENPFVFEYVFCICDTIFLRVSLIAFPGQPLSGKRTNSTTSRLFTMSWHLVAFLRHAIAAAPISSLITSGMARTKCWIQYCALSSAMWTGSLLW